MVATSGARLVTLVAAGVLLLVLLPDLALARPSGVISRQKRVSDQRLAELETLLALAKMRGKLVTVPVGFGRVDPAKIGRKRRSNVDSDLQKLRQILQAVAREESVSVSEERDELPSSNWKDIEYRHRVGTEDQLI
ncbi:uncharacterized protein LOC105702680 [Orussus abietinus]|uniref:uncharacterized protein LOC105702680 n=1 Tax=Orussus abietinus TaxID=222816 RepID=UPI0006250A38|nr:uncharacterized protein LOC105702680 [Orussus abietinus]